MFKCKTVGELKKALKIIDDETLLFSSGPDSGGYDCISKEEVVVYPWSSGLYVGGTDESTVNGKLSYEV